jgi:hypothetical protein
MCRWVSECVVVGTGGKWRAAIVVVNGVHVMMVMVAVAVEMVAG